MDPVSIGLLLASKFAPEIIKYFGGGDTAATVAGQVIDIAKTVTGGADPVAALDADPQLAARFRSEVLAASTTLELAYLGDRKDARALQVAALAQDDRFSKRFVYGFAAIWSVYTMIYAWAITFWPPVSESGKTNAATILGFLLGTAVASIFSYFYGSNRGSEAKSKLLAEKA